MIYLYEPTTLPLSTKQKNISSYHNIFVLKFVVEKIFDIGMDLFRENKCFKK